MTLAQSRSVSQPPAKYDPKWMFWFWQKVVEGAPILVANTVPYADSTGTLTSAANTLTWDGSTFTLGTVDTMTIHGSLITSTFVANSDTRSIVELHSHSDTAFNSSVVYAARTRGTTTAPTIVQNGDLVLQQAATAYDGTDYELLGYTQWEVDGVPGANDMPGKWGVFTTPDGDFNPIRRLTVDNAGNVIIGGDTSATELRLLEPSGSGTNYTGFKSPVLAANVIYTLPTADGTSGQVLSTNGSKVLSWTAAGAASVGGSNTQIQFNDSSAFGGDADFTWDKTNNLLTIGGTTTASGLKFSGTNQRLQGDFSTATIVNRLAMQTSTANGATWFTVVPNGTSTTAAVNLENAASPANNTVLTFNIQGNTAYIGTFVRGTGTLTPLLLVCGSTSTTERGRIDTTGNFVWSTAALGTTATDGFIYMSSCAGTPTGVPTAYTGRIPLVFDSTNNRFYTYSSGWKTPFPFDGNFSYSTSTGVLTLGTTTSSSGITFAGTSNRIKGDFTNATIASRLHFQTSTANSSTFVGIIPNGTANVAGISLETDSAVTNSATLLIYMYNTTTAMIRARSRGTGTVPSLLFTTGNSEPPTTIGTMDPNGNFVWNSAAIATTATNGFIYIPTCAGTPTGVPTTYTGRVPLVYDSTNNKLYIYNGAWKGATFA